VKSEEWRVKSEEWRVKSEEWRESPLRRRDAEIVFFSAPLRLCGDLLTPSPNLNP
jgi:hypothetical protein